MARGADVVARVLVAFGEELAVAGAAQTGDAFTDDAAADALVKHDANAFLLGVLFTQGISAERAWAGPQRLLERLGHLELPRLAGEPDVVAAAFAQPPALHRFVKTVPKWVTAAAQMLLECYGGDAARIWEPGSHVLDVTERLRAFPGIGEKKAVMAVEILMRHFGVALEGAECGSVAYDVQVRRVFLRAGLAGSDTPEAMRAAAAAACPERPGTLDLPAWLIGRTWCRPARPRCDECRLGGVCPRLTALAAEGVGVRRQSSERKSSPESSFG